MVVPAGEVNRTGIAPPAPTLDTIFGNTLRATSRDEDRAAGCYRGISAAHASRTFDPSTVAHVATCLRFPEVMRRTGRTFLDPLAIDVDSALRGYRSRVSMGAGAPEVPEWTKKVTANEACPQAATA